VTIPIGTTASRTQTFTDEAVRIFAQVSGDDNPIHLDDAYAQGTPFGRRLVHGILTASLISATIANDLPGRGSIYMSQTLKFTVPVFIGDTVTATVEVIDFRERRRIVTLQTTCTNQDGKVVLTGEAVVMAPEPAT
jgi:3-hydroxybutyryl-CoA dehydratase